MKVAVVGAGHVGLAVFGKLKSMAEINELVLIGADFEKDKVQGEIEDYLDGDVLERNSLLSTMSLSTTSELRLLGISMPMAFLPGIGASMRRRGAASAMVISPCSAVMREMRTPGAGWISMRVIMATCTRA